jgi:hypothetical protein
MATATLRSAFNWVGAITGQISDTVKPKLSSITEHQDRLAVIVSDKFFSFVIQPREAYDRSLKNAVQTRIFTQKFQSTEEALTALDALAIRWSEKVNMKYDLTPYSKSLSLFLKDVGDYARELRGQLGTEPGLHATVDATHVLAQQELVPALQAACLEKKIELQRADFDEVVTKSPVKKASVVSLTSSPIDKLKGRMSQLPSSTREAKGLVVDDKTAAYDALPGQLETAFGTSKIEMHDIVTGNKRDAQRSFLSATVDAIVKKVLSVLTSIVMNVTAVFGVRWAVSTVVSTVAGPATTAAVSNTCFFICVAGVAASYTARASSWNHQRERESVVSFVRNRVGNPFANLTPAAMKASIVTTTQRVVNSSLEKFGPYFGLKVEKGVEKFNAAVIAQ